VTGVQTAAFASNFPFNPGGILAGPNLAIFQIAGRPAGKGEALQMAANGVSPEYFETVGQRLVEGRVFTDHDDEKSEDVAIINDSTVRHHWAGENPIGSRISADEGKSWLRIAGVVADAKEYGLDRPVRDEVYVPIKQNGFTNNLLVRSAGDPLAMAAAIRAAIREIDSQVAIDRLNSVEQFRYDSMSSPRVTTILLGLFAGLAVLISACGIAAVMALAVSQRTNELGIRMALGASSASIVSLVVRQGLALSLAGTAVGLAGALAFTRLLSSLLYATSPTDVATFAGVTALFLTIAAVASFLPARQVTAIDPLDALRRE
jgi:putative ABC transport system permease protein